MYYYLFSYMMFNVGLPDVRNYPGHPARFLDGKINILVYKLVFILSLKRHLSGVATVETW